MFATADTRARCKTEGCITLLNSYNPGPHCLCHKATAQRAERGLASLLRPLAQDASDKAIAALGRTIAKPRAQRLHRMFGDREEVNA